MPVLIAIINNGDGPQQIVGMLQADSVDAAFVAFVANYDPPLNPDDYVAIDISNLLLDPENPWRTYDHDTEEFVQSEDPLTRLKAQRYEQIDARTVELIFQGFTHAGKVFSLSLPAQSYWTNMLVAKDILTATGAFPLRVNTLDDTDAHNIADATEVVTFYATAVGTVKGRLGSGTVLKDQIRAATTVDEVEDVVDER